MTVFMVIAACYGVIQLAALGSLTRSVKAGLLLTAVAVGIYGAGLATVLLQIVYTRSVAELTGDRLSDVVRTASYTVDPFLEEVVKVLPLALVAWQQRVRRQWGLTDYLLLGAATGAGFGLTEAILRYSHRSGAAIAGDGGWTIPQGFSASHIPGPFEILFTWLPEPVSSESIFSLTAGSDINLHLAWSALAGLGVGLIMRAPGRWKLLGIAPVFYVWADHAVFNHEIVAPDKAGFVDALSIVINPLHGGLSIYVVLAMVAAGVLDFRVLRAKAGQWDLLTAPERMGQPSVQALGAYARLRPPWTPLVAWRFALSRRSLLFADAAGATRAEPLRQAVVEIRDRIDASSTAEAWRRVNVGELKPDAKRYRMLVVWIVLLLPAFGYFVLGGFRQTAGLQRFLTGQVMFVVSMLVMLAGLGWLGWQAVQAMRRLPAARQFGELTARVQFRLMIASGGLAIGALTVVRWLGGADARSPAVSNLHILDALGSALFYTSLALALLALFMFPPSLLALAGGGALLVIPGALSTSLGIAALMGMLGILLMSASGGGGGGSGSGGGGSGNPPPPKPDMPQKPPAVKPSTADPKLNNLLDNIYKGTNSPTRIGNGTTMDAVRNEILTGRPTGGRWHATKARETINGLQNWLRRNPGASQADQDIARNLIQELQNALKGI